MKEYFSVIKKTGLFDGIDDDEFENVLDCLHAKAVEYKKGEHVFSQGKKIENLAILASGVLHIQNDDYWGSRSIINSVVAGEMFGESYAVENAGVMPNDVVAASDSRVIFLDMKAIFDGGGYGDGFHALIAKNLLLAVSEKNRALVQRFGHISKRSTRKKLTSYLSEQAKKQNSATFKIPFNRQQLADFLFCDRSALSNELCKMRDEGLLTFHKNEFTLL